MIPKTPQAALDAAVDLYLSGVQNDEIRRVTGVSESVLHRERAVRGIPSTKGVRLPDAEIASAYLSGESELSLSRRYGVGRPAIRKRLLAAGAEIRGPAAATTLAQLRMSPDVRVKNTQAAHDAMRGTKMSHAELVQRAISREKNGIFGSPGEQKLAKLLAARALAVVPQKAIDKYNADLAVGRVGIEVLGGNWHEQKAVRHKVRVEKIMSQGWSMVFVWNTDKDIICGAAADYIAQLCKASGSGPEYRVITGSGRELLRGNPGDDRFTLAAPRRR